jgi:hypothetical protein
MIASTRPPSPSPEVLLASLRGAVQRLEQSENPVTVLFLKELLVERIAELEKQTDETPPVGS